MHDVNQVKKHRRFPQRILVDGCDSLLDRLAEFLLLKVSLLSISLMLKHPYIFFEEAPKILQAINNTALRKENTHEQGTKC